MRTHLGTIALVFAVALAAAGGGYALGTQSGGGTAKAVAGAPSTVGVSAARPHRFGVRPFAAQRRARLAALAQRIGVDPARLRDALRQLRAQRMAARRRALAGELARILGVPEPRVEGALPMRVPRGFCRRP
jgi:hypothetical protein